jgi:hypothetical protein
MTAILNGAPTDDEESDTSIQKRPNYFQFVGLKFNAQNLGCHLLTPRLWR